MTVVVQDGVPLRVFHDPSQVDPYLEGHAREGRRTDDAEVWSVPVGRSFGAAEKVERAS